jgi:predicted oxidoreductase (fatty acid repression mutant protein)
VYYAAASQKYMLVILDGDENDKLRAYIESFNRYIVCDNNVESIKEALKTIQSAQERVEYQVPEIFLPENNVREIIS